MDKLVEKLLTTEDGSFSLRHPGHGEAFHSFSGAKKEAFDLYICGSGFRQALDQTDSVRVLDVGLGLGYNAMTTIETWWNHRERPCDLELVSLEHDATLIKTLRSGQASWQKNWSTLWLDWLGKDRVVRSDGALGRWRIIAADALECPLEGHFDFIWQDPFSPKNNPKLWSKPWFRKLTSHSNDHTTLMTYSVARSVKDALSATEWHVELIPTTTTKRSWLRAKRRKF